MPPIVAMAVSKEGIRFSKGGRVDNRVTEQKIGRIRKRPDGTNEKDYAKCDKWTPRRWAWEFLRRNPSFLSDSKAVVGGNEAEQRKVAEKYSLKRFKPANEAFRGPHGLPVFIGSSIRSWTNWDESILELTKIKLKQSQVVILFDLEKTMVDRRSLRAQLREAEKRLRSRLAELEVVRRKKADDHKPKSHVLKTYLRLLDLKDVAKKSPLESILIVDKVRRAAYENDPVAVGIEIHSFATAKIKSAVGYSKEGYRFVANMNSFI